MSKVEVTDHLEKKYESINKMCQNYKINRSTYNTRIHNGWCQEKALCEPSQKQNLSDRNFNFLHVIKSTNKRTSSGKIIWECRCICGNTTYVSSDKLISKETKSCGCIKDNIVHKSCRRPNKGKKSKGISLRENGKYRARIMRDQRNYYLGTFDSESDAQAIYNISNSFVDMKNFMKWFSNKEFYFKRFKEICTVYNIDMIVLTESIYNNFCEHLYFNVDELKLYVKDFCESYLY